MVGNRRTPGDPRLGSSGARDERNSATLTSIRQRGIGEANARAVLDVVTTSLIASPRHNNAGWLVLAEMECPEACRSLWVVGCGTGVAMLPF